MPYPAALNAFKAANAAYQAAIRSGTTDDMVRTLDAREAAARALNASRDPRLFGIGKALTIVAASR